MFRMLISVRVQLHNSHMLKDGFAVFCGDQTTSQRTKARADLESRKRIWQATTSATKGSIFIQAQGVGRNNRNLRLDTILAASKVPITFNTMLNITLYMFLNSCGISVAPCVSQSWVLTVIGIAACNVMGSDRLIESQVQTITIQRAGMTSTISEDFCSRSLYIMLGPVDVAIRLRNRLNCSACQCSSIDTWNANQSTHTLVIDSLQNEMAHHSSDLGVLLVVGKACDIFLCHFCLPSLA